MLELVALQVVWMGCANGPKNGYLKTLLSHALGKMLHDLFGRIVRGRLAG